MLHVSDQLIAVPAKDPSALVILIEVAGRF